MTNAIISLLRLFFYVGYGYGLYYMAASCGLRHRWMAWVPYGKIHLLGTIADHYNATKHSRISHYGGNLLLSLVILSVIAFGGAILLFGTAVAALFAALTAGASDTAAGEALAFALPSEFIILGVALLLAVAVYLLFFFLALNRVYRHFMPERATLWTVLSLLLLPVPVFFILIGKRPPATDV